MDVDSIVKGPSIFHKAGLAETNNVRKERLDSEDDNIYDQLVKGIAQRNRSKFFDVACIRTLRNKANEGFIHGGVHSVSLKGIFAKSKHLVLHYIPVFLKKNWLNPIRTMSFEEFEDFIALMISESLQRALSMEEAEALRIVMH